MKSVRAEWLDSDGYGVSEDNVRVRDLLPGEQASIVTEHRSPHGRGVWARIESRVGELSAERAEPACPAHGVCGGCKWQHLNYPGQLREKRLRLIRALGADIEIADTVASPKTTHYRNKGKYVVAGGVLGSYKPRSSKVISTLGCAVVEEPIDAIARAAQRAERPDGLRYLLVRTGADGRVVATLVAWGDTKMARLEALADALLAAGATGVVHSRNDREDGGLLGEPTRPLRGDAMVGERIAGVVTDVDPNAFWQVNRDVADLIYARIGELLADSPGRVLDAYAGVGAIGLSAARTGADVTAVEIDERAAEATRRIASEAGLELDVRTGDTKSVIGGEFDAIVVNPPRRGLSANVCELIGTGGASRVVYLSCGPESLARDLDRLKASGFAITSVTPYDMMPGTGQVETLALLSR